MPLHTIQTRPTQRGNAQQFPQPSLPNLNPDAPLTAPPPASPTLWPPCPASRSGEACEVRQHNLNSGNQISCSRSGHLRPTLIVKLQVFTLSDRHALQSWSQLSARFHSVAQPRETEIRNCPLRPIRRAGCACSTEPLITLPSGRIR